MTDPSGPDFFDIVTGQRACRAFRPNPVPDTDIERMLTAATHAPSAENLQPWVFVVVTDDARRAQIGDVNARAWDGGGSTYAQARLAPALFADVDRSVRECFGGAPVVIVVAADTNLTSAATLGSSLFPAVQNLLLAANALGYGSALTTLSTVTLSDDVRTIVGLPDTLRPVAVIPVGRPARPLGPPRREPASTKTYRERYGSPW